MVCQANSLVAWVSFAKASRATVLVGTAVGRAQAKVSKAEVGGPSQAAAKRAGLKWAGLTQGRQLLELPMHHLVLATQLSQLATQPSQVHTGGFCDAA